MARGMARGTEQTTAQHGAPHVAASGLINRSVHHVDQRSMAPRAVVLVGVPSGSWLNCRNRSDAGFHPQASFNV